MTVKFWCMDIAIDEHTALVFDLDDTLYNELDYLKSAYWEICFYCNPDKAKELYHLIFSLYRSDQNPFKYITEKFEISLPELISNYRNHVPKLNPFPGVLKVFQEVKQKKGKLGVITDGRVITQTNKLKSLGLLKYIDYVVISEDIGSEKPHRKNYEAMMDKLNAERYYYFGDNFKKDFIAPLKMGWHTVGLIDNGKNIHHNSYAYLENKPEHLIQSFEEIIIR